MSAEEIQARFHEMGLKLQADDTPTRKDVRAFFLCGMDLSMTLWARIRGEERARLSTPPLSSDDARAYRELRATNARLLERIRHLEAQQVTADALFERDLESDPVKWGWYQAGKALADRGSVILSPDTMNKMDMSLLKMVLAVARSTGAPWTPLRESPARQRLTPAEEAERTPLREVE